MENFKDVRLQEFEEKYSYFNEERIEQLYRSILEKSLLTFNWLSLESPDQWIMHVKRSVNKFDHPEIKNEQYEIIQYFLLFCDVVERSYIVRNLSNEKEEFTNWLTDIVEVNSLFNTGLKHIVVESSEKDTENILEIYFR